jgi:hypothetical protein
LKQFAVTSGKASEIMSEAVEIANIYLKLMLSAFKIEL